jgi:hypothetical protein
VAETGESEDVGTRATVPDPIVTVQVFAELKSGSDMAWWHTHARKQCEIRAQFFNQTPVKVYRFRRIKP